MSLLLVGLGFLLGQYYAIARGKLWQTSKVIWSTADFPTFGSFKEGDKIFSSIVNDESIVQEFKENSPEEEKDVQFPSKVGNLYIDKIISGKEALEHSQQIFGSEAPVKRLFIPYYSSSENQAVVWVFEMNSPVKALQYLEKINLRIEESETFHHSGSFFLQNVEVYYVKGLNFDNYYYCKDNIIYWISLIAHDPIPLFLKFYEHF
jgi:hypothetical protein